MSRPRPLNPTQTTTLADDLAVLAAILHRPDTPTILARIATAAEIGYPRTTNNGSGGGATPDPLTPTTDTTARYATDLLTELHRLRHDIAPLIHALRGWDPNRPVATCTACGHCLDRDTTRCRRLDDNGQPCGASIGAWPPCKDCRQPMAPGHRRDGRCDTCRKYLARNGYTRATILSYREQLDEAREWAAGTGAAHA